MSKDQIWYLMARKLAGEASSQELKELELLIEKNKISSQDLEFLFHLWEMQLSVDEEYLEATYYLHLQRLSKSGLSLKSDTEPAGKIHVSSTTIPSKKIKRFIAVFASLVVIITVAVVFFMPQKSKIAASAKVEAVPKEIITKKGSKIQYKLPDGSTVWLNAGSKLNYDKINESGVREVYLTGEGYFDVVRNPKRPFIIHTSKIDIKVLGTQFNVKAYPNDKTVETSLIHGSVEVFVKNRPGEKYLLKPNQKLVLLNETEDEVKQTESSLPIIAIKRLTYVQNDTLAIETSWTMRRFIFEKESFIEVARKMERWYDVKIEFKKKSLEQEILTGDFTKETLKQALDALRFTVNFKYKIDATTVTIY